MINEKTFARTARKSSAPPPVHVFTHRKYSPDGPRYVALCGTSAANITGIAAREVTCGKCIAKIPTEQR
jgi:hypothetical protein